ncbi:DUF4349 domain-containing protein [Candidatus Peregrinibacteria bacterium]|uniref:DUF4349 domain-containing protein n=1 Tax=Candidatus Roizmanbacteria bacterium CG22_combo_CG10-13_8_21_14_all_38_20 TaxID=1974862 RepID=A0A2H0BVI0_9BACT|nr:DUF4349 domain-containing protein [Candidatus Peregrinibacteria bacterium]PIP61685.1 MAG: hypothetical protein COW99_02855 [Candidatus Roizmanbacteria bacterium CG22_combo_CG10-13_8_21_14_all_38_20]PJC31391.1 MAG: hypothetical protein CO050_03400 [Candidatus Roizmanbacteria bacterium CG_4_9_14_0_2_um_filter_38_17]
MKKKVIYGVVLLLAVIGAWGVIQSTLNSYSYRNAGYAGDYQMGLAAPSAQMGKSMNAMENVMDEFGRSEEAYYPEQNAPVPNEAVEDRLVVRNGTTKAVVKDVIVARDQVQTKITQANGFVVSSYLSHPETAPHLSMSVRIPAEKLDEVMQLVRDNSERITYESVESQDVTDQYVDEMARLTSLEKVREQMDSIIEQATEISDLLNLQREIQRIDQQIEFAKGRITYLQQSSALSLLNIELAQSELELSITPTEKWQPVFVFKQAVRNLLTTLYGLSYLVIRLAVYALIWIPVGIIVVLIYRRIRKKLISI